MRKVLIPVALLLTAAFASAQGHGGPHFRFAGSDGGSMVQLALRADVQKDMGVSGDQKSKLVELEQRMQDAVAANLQEFEKNKESDPNKMRDAIGATGDKFAAELPTVLTADQAKRLKQILIQKAGYGYVQRKEVQDELGLSDDQRAKIATAQADLLKAFDGFRTSSTMDPKMMRKASQEAIEARNQAIADALTADQRAKFEEMKGAPFTFDDEIKG